ncbi:hypothetical protein POM88_012851 [Heracleum sosnowskyi]|uniref:Uncharacterized protein n=1 Tax=Heracleum sosnowskyi TaxID=360622 RepID=A0AAD8MXM2_9APIA|nr:hypothetical protein POM88_012851 [Heracleum sosnowskyi]
MKEMVIRLSSLTKSEIIEIQLQGRIVDGHDEVANVVVDFFKECLESPHIDLEDINCGTFQKRSLIVCCIKEGEGEGEGEGEEEEGGDVKPKARFTLNRPQLWMMLMPSLWLQGKKPRRLELWEQTHTTAASRRANMGGSGAPLVYTTPEAMAIAARYSAILEREGVDLTPGIELTEPIQWWLQATTNGAEKPKKNRLIGFPNVPASSLLPDLAHHYREGTRGGASSSSSAPNRSPTIPDHLFVQVVRHAVTSAQADPAYFQRQLDDRELEGLARNLLEVSDPESRGNFNNVFFREVVNVVISIMKDICNKYEEETQAVSLLYLVIEEANQEFTEGESSEYDDSGSDGEAGRANDDHGDAEM